MKLIFILIGVIFIIILLLALFLLRKQESDWIVGQWSNCSQVCGGGEETRSVVCPNGVNCSPNKPSTSEKCNTQPCQSTWSVGTWSECNVKCGGGSEQRIVSCPTASVGCLGIQPSTSQPCNMQNCPNSPNGIVPPSSQQNNTPVPSPYVIPVPLPIIPTKNTSSESESIPVPKPPVIANNSSECPDGWEILPNSECKNVNTYTKCTPGGISTFNGYSESHKRDWAVGCQVEWDAVGYNQTCPDGWTLNKTTGQCISPSGANCSPASFSGYNFNGIQNWAKQCNTNWKGVYTAPPPLPSSCGVNVQNGNSPIQANNPNSIGPAPGACMPVSGGCYWTQNGPSSTNPCYNNTLSNCNPANKWYYNYSCNGGSLGSNTTAPPPPPPPPATPVISAAQEQATNTYLNSILSNCNVCPNGWSETGGTKMFPVCKPPTSYINSFLSQSATPPCQQVTFMGTESQRRYQLQQCLNPYANLPSSAWTNMCPS